VTLFEKTLQYFDECKIALAEKFAPPYIASICAHLLNIENQKREFHFEQGRVANLRIHVYFIAPPGFFKTLMLSKFCDGKFSILGSELIPVAFEGSMTEAGFVGSFRMEGGEFKENRGAAWEHRESILAIDEFSALTALMQQEHSMSLESAMLTSLDSGFVSKRLAPGRIQYMTQASLWTGSQPLKFNLASGLARRFVFIYFIPTLAEEALIRKMRRQGKNIIPPKELLFEIKEEIAKCMDFAKEVQKIEYTDAFYSMLDKMEVPHFEEALYERIAAGLTLATLQEPGPVLVVKPTDLIRKFFQLEAEWRLDIKAGADTSQVFWVCRQMAGCSATDIKKHLTGIMGMDYEEATRLMSALERQGRIVLRTAQGEKGRKVKLVFTVD